MVGQMIWLKNRRILYTEKDFPLGERNIEIRIKFGGTFIDVKAIHLKSQKIINGTLVFDK